jgi:hypothetical protein
MWNEGVIYMATENNWMEKPSDGIYIDHVTVWELPKNGSVVQVVQNGHCVNWGRL